MAVVRATTIANMLLGIALLAAGPTMAEDGSLPPARASEPERDEWRSRIDDARRRVEQLRREGRLSPVTASPQQRDDERSRRALEDSNLQVGDIVSTSHGLFRFEGRSKDMPETNYFSPIGRTLPPASSGAK